MKTDYKNYAWIGICPVCSQGRQIIARENRSEVLYVLCEDCESEWRMPQEARDIGRVSRDTFTESTLLTREDLGEDPWRAFLEE
jgi:hypothetical protein